MLSEGDELHIGQSKFRFELAGTDAVSDPDEGSGWTGDAPDETGRA
jgi:hypothetical protein